MKNLKIGSRIVSPTHKVYEVTEIHNDGSITVKWEVYSSLTGWNYPTEVWKKERVSLIMNSNYKINY